MKRIIYTKGNGDLCIVVPAPESGLTIEQVAEKSVPSGLSFEIVEDTAIPTDRTFRNAWENVGGIKVNMPKARNIKRDQIRLERDELLKALDIEMLRAVEANDRAKQATITARKQALRDAPSDPAIDAAQTPEQLKAVRPRALDD